VTTGPIVERIVAVVGTALATLAVSAIGGFEIHERSRRGENEDVGRGIAAVIAEGRNREAELKYERDRAEAELDACRRWRPRE